MPQNYSICIQRYLLSTAFWYSYGFVCLCPHCQVVMEDVEQRTLATLPVKPLFWKRYVDNVFSAVSANEAERLLSHFEFSGAIQFTLEREKDRHLPFLVCRAEQGNLETSVYRKPTHTDKYFAFDSQHPGLFAIKSL